MATREEQIKEYLQFSDDFMARIEAGDVEEEDADKLLIAAFSFAIRAQTLAGTTRNQRLITETGKAVLDRHDKLAMLIDDYRTGADRYAKMLERQKKAKRLKPKKRRRL